MRGGGTIQTIFQILDELGYDVSWKIHNSKNYGVPQNRERVFIEGYSRRKCGGEILLETRNSGEALADKRKLKTYRDKSRRFSIYDDGDTLSRTITSTGQNSGYNQIIKEGNVFDGGGQAGNVYNINGLSCTLSANGGGAGGKTGLYKIEKVGNVSPSGHHDGDVFSTKGVSRTLCARDYKSPVKIHQDFNVRRLTPLECERLQAFPDNWTKYGADGKLISDTQRYKMCGNAVTTSVITYIVNEMFDKIKLNIN